MAVLTTHPLLLKTDPDIYIPMLQVLTSDYANQVLKLIRASVSSIDILSYVVNFNLYKKSDKVNLIYLELKKSVSSHKIVRVILDFPRLHKSNYHCNKFSTRRFKEAGIDVRFLSSGDTQHAKLIIFDGLTSVFGSHNLTSRSVVNRYDISLVVDDLTLVKFFSSYFNSLWETSIEL